MTIQIQLRQIVAGQNPRHFFDPKTMAELEDSIAANGVVQAILVRPLASGLYEIIAGERRFRAACKVLAADATIPALVREADDAEAERLALVENTEREGMTPVEEAEAADKVVTRCDGDLAEASRLLGWPLFKLKKRLSLMHCAKVVRNALEDRLITLGHAELLAAVPAEKQETALPLVVQHQMTTDQLKAQLLSKARKLDEAIFDCADCAECPHNSTVQADMFSTTVGQGNCTNPPCFQAKTEAHVAVLVDQLAETYGKVIMLKIDEKPSLTRLIIGGKTGVSVEQAEACKTCSSFGATISALPGSEGKVAEPVCFNLACNAAKVAEANVPPPAVETKAPVGPDTQESKAAAKTNATATAAPTASTTPAKAAAKLDAEAPRMNPKALRQGLIDYRRERWNQALMKVALTYPALQVRKLLVLMVLAGEARAIESDMFRKALHQKAEKSGQPISEKRSAFNEIQAASDFVMASEETVIDRFVSGTIACAAAAMSVETLTSLLTISGASINDSWKPQADFWTLLTKSEIDAVGTEIGLAAHMGKDWKPMLLKKKAEIEAAIAASSFDFTGKSPKFMEFK